MIRGLFFCALACAAAAPANAGERDVALRAVRALPALTLPPSDHFPLYGGALTIRDFTVKLRQTPAPTIALDDFENLQVPSLDAVAHPVIPDQAAMVSPYAMSDLRSLDAWRLTGRIAPTTASANGLYAVRDGLGEYRKPRAFRPSPLNAMLVLRIDGKDDSPPFSVGGGGVAAALWRAKTR